jgi:glycosyltransferase involved in cell wall biosynthesis
MNSKEASKLRVIAVIPALNEEHTLGAVLKETKRYVDDIVVVDDASTDRTAQVARAYATVITHQTNKGYDASLNDGFLRARKSGADIIITLDADGQHLPSDIPRLIGPIKEGTSDVVVGKRPYPARIMESAFGRYGKRFGISDPLCGMKAYRATVYDALGTFDSITSIGTQLTFFAQLKGYRVSEIPIQLKMRRDTPRFGRRIRANVKLFSALMRLRRYVKTLSTRQ